MRLRHSIPLLAVLALGCAPAVMPAPTPSGEAVPFQEVKLEPPPAGEGVQLTVGPFDVQPGSEVQKNFFMKFPSDQDVQINRVQISYPMGSHHCNLFRSDNAATDHVEDTFAAIDYEKYQMFAAAQTGNLDWTYPQGVGLSMKKQHQLLVQTHWVNGKTQVTPTGKGQVKINFWFAKPGSITTPLGMAFVINKNLDILPRTETKSTKLVDFARLGYEKDMELLAMTGHFHSRGKSFELNRYDGKATGAEIYRSDNWDEPPFVTFEKPVPLKAREQLMYTATFVNTSDLVIKFGPQVETQEHSNLFMYFIPGPADGKALYDVNGLP